MGHVNIWIVLASLLGTNTSMDPGNEETYPWCEKLKNHAYEGVAWRYIRDEVNYVFDGIHEKKYEDWAEVFECLRQYTEVPTNNPRVRGGTLAAMAAIPAKGQFANWLLLHYEELAGSSAGWETIATGLGRRKADGPVWRSDMVAVLAREARANPIEAVRGALWVAVGPHLTTEQAIESIPLLTTERLPVRWKLAGALAYHPHPKINTALLKVCRSTDLVSATAFSLAAATRYDLLGCMTSLRERVKTLGERARDYYLDDILIAEKALKDCKTKKVPIGTPQPHSLSEVKCSNLGRPTVAAPQQE